MRNSTEKNARERAEKAFADHEITVVFESECGEFRQYRCAKPETICYSFTLTFYPGWVVMTGDIGHLAASRIRDMMTFVRDVLSKDRPDCGYFAEKVPQEIVTKEFCPRMTKESLHELLRNSDRKLDRSTTREVFEFDNEYDFFNSSVPILERHGFYDLYEHAARDLKWQFYFQCFALRWFIREYDRQHAARTDLTAATV